MPISSVAELVSSTDIGVVPKRSDSFGNEAFSTKIMEFMASGVPVLASETRIDRFYFNDQIVEFFESGNAVDLAGKLLALHADRARREELRTNALDFIQETYWVIRKQEYLNLVDQLVGPEQVPAVP